MSPSEVSEREGSHEGPRVPQRRRRLHRLEARRPDPGLPRLRSHPPAKRGRGARQDLGRLRNRRVGRGRAPLLHGLAHPEVPVDRLHGRARRHGAVSRRADGRSRQEEPAGRRGRGERLDRQDHALRRGHAEHRGVFQSRDRRRAVGLAPARRDRPRPEDRQAPEDHLHAERLLPQLSRRSPRRPALRAARGDAEEEAPRVRRALRAGRSSARSRR